MKTNKQTMKERDNTEQMFLGEVLQHFSKLQYHDLVSKILLHIRFNETMKVIILRV
jgi:hypothetical protein